MVAIERRTPRISEVTPLRDAIDRLFDQSFIGRRPMLPAFMTEGDRPALDIKWTPEALEVTAAMPGVDPKDVETTITGDTLTIGGTFGDEKKTDEEGYLYREISRGAFHRSLTLPRGLLADEATATFHNGLLTLHIPRSEEEKPHTIEVKPT
jgi:HSP20 family protein